eukprot:5037917-Ditylum_brightwellii.AAC.1
MEWEEEIETERKEGEEEDYYETQDGKTSINKHEFYKLGIEIGQERILQCRNGDNLDLEVTDDVFYLYFQNFNGINQNNSGADFLDELTILKDLGCSVVQGSEGNSNWSQGDTYNKAREII